MGLPSPWYIGTALLLAAALAACTSATDPGDGNGGGNNGGGNSGGGNPPPPVEAGRFTGADGAGRSVTGMAHARATAAGGTGGTIELLLASTTLPAGHDGLWIHRRADRPLAVGDYDVVANATADDHAFEAGLVREALTQMPVYCRAETGVLTLDGFADGLAAGRVQLQLRCRRLRSGAPAWVETLAVRFRATLGQPAVVPAQLRLPVGDLPLVAVDGQPLPARAFTEYDWISGEELSRIEAREGRLSLDVDGSYALQTRWAAFERGTPVAVGTENDWGRCSAHASGVTCASSYIQNRAYLGTATGASLGLRGDAFNAGGPAALTFRRS